MRELKHAIERAYILSASTELTVQDLFEDATLTQYPGSAATEIDLSRYLQECERRYILQALDRHQRHMGNTAAALGISRKNLWEKMRKLGIQADPGIHA